MRNASPSGINVQMSSLEHQFESIFTYHYVWSNIKMLAYNDFIFSVIDIEKKIVFEPIDWCMKPVVYEACYY